MPLPDAVSASHRYSPQPRRVFLLSKQLAHPRSESIFRPLASSRSTTLPPEPVQGSATLPEKYHRLDSAPDDYNAPPPIPSLPHTRHAAYFQSPHPARPS